MRLTEKTPITKLCSFENIPVNAAFQFVGEDRTIRIKLDSDNCMVFEAVTIGYAWNLPNDYQKPATNITQKVVSVGESPTTCRLLKISEIIYHQIGNSE